MSGTVISYPIPAYSNVPINAQFYQPSRFVISNISLGQTTTITTTDDMNYVVGQNVRFIIPPEYGTRQLNGQQGIVLSLPASNQVEVNIDSQFYSPFVAGSGSISPQILAIGDINSGYTSTTGRTINTINGNTQIAIPGSFINISPD